MRRLSTCVLLTVMAWLGACANVPVTPEQRRLAEQRLLEPFLRAVEVGCGELQIDITGNFHGNVGQPAPDAKLHQVVRQPGDGYQETVWTNVSGAPASAFHVTIGDAGELTERGLVTGPRTKFVVMNQLRLRIYEDVRPMTLNAHATGPIVVVREAKGKPRDVQEFAVVDGVLRTP